MTADKRPHDCRNRLRDNGMTHPKSGCQHCRTGGLTGCPYEHNRCMTCEGNGVVWRGHPMGGDYETCNECKGTGEMTKINLYEGARVQLRNGEIIHNLKPYKIGKMSWTGRRRADGHLFTWAENGKYFPDEQKDHPLDIVAVSLINRIESIDVDTFRAEVTNRDPMFANTLDEYQRIATKSAIYPGKGTPFGLMYVALGLAEAGEVQNKVKKAFRDDDVISFDAISDDKTAATVHFEPLTSERRAQIIKELGGAFWYIAACCNEIGATMSEVALANLEELCDRTERGTLQGDGDDR